MGDVKKCPKCDEDIVEGMDLAVRYSLRDMSVSFRKKGDWLGDRVTPYLCKKCGFVELYKEIKEKKE